MKPVNYIPNFIWKLNYNFEYEGGVLQYDVGCLFDEIAKKDMYSKLNDDFLSK